MKKMYRWRKIFWFHIVDTVLGPYYEYLFFNRMKISVHFRKRFLY